MKMEECPFCENGWRKDLRLIGYDENNKPVYITDWYECSKCDGTGFIQKEKEKDDKR